jgi:hypothetical protein
MGHLRRTCIPEAAQACRLKKALRIRAKATYGVTPGRARRRRIGGTAWVHKIHGLRIYAHHLRLPTTDGRTRPEEVDKAITFPLVAGGLTRQMT